ncbi:interaptin-like [Dendronephthya gigantea]|uniref:interaptin-like n=1 Tax=Dendronephthya gigantea TaxID=151771 RepID=UPI00106DBF43|nr:interaptin-like [Dendronephthya gigantea]
MAGTSLPVDISILEDQVIEVTEMEDAMEECMMFVKKLSETSLTEMEKEKQKLQELLQKAEKEMRNTKQALKRSCSKRDEWRDKCLLERDVKTHAERQLKDAKQRIQKMETVIEEHKNSMKSLQQQKARSTETAKELRDKIVAEKTRKQQLEGELCEAKKSLEKVKSDNEELQKQLHNESQKSMQRANIGEDHLAALKRQLAQEKTQFASFEKESAGRIRHLEEKISEQQAINKRLSDEAETNISELEMKLSTSEEAVIQLRKCNEDLREKLSDVEKDSEKFEGRFEALRSENEALIDQKDTRICELVEQLKETKKKLTDSEMELSKRDDKTMESKQEQTENKSWANIVDEESLQELQEKYDKLHEEHSVIQRQFAHLKKHRNQVLRENNELHYHVQMATLQLASGNTRFRQQIDQFRVRLQVAESMYEDKVLECNMLDSQLKQVFNGEMYAGEVVYPGHGYV